MVEQRRLHHDLLALALMGLAVFVGLSLLSFDPADPPSSLVFPGNDVPTNTCGRVGAILAHDLYAWFGVAAWGVLLVFAFLSVRLFLRQWPSDLPHRIVGWAMVFFSACVSLQTAVEGACPASIAGTGGYLGAYGSKLLEQEFAGGGTNVVLFTSFAAGMLLAVDDWLLWLLGTLLLGPFRLMRYLAFGKRRAAIVAQQTPTTAVAAGTATVLPVSAAAASSPTRIEKPMVRVAGTAVVPPELSRRNDADTDSTADDFELLADIDEQICNTLGISSPVDTASAVRQPVRVNAPQAAPARAAAIIRPVLESPPAVVHPSVDLPSLDLLEASEEFPFELLAEKARAAAVTLEKTFHEFGMNVRVVEIDTGPVVTQFELELEAGLRLAKVAALADDLAIALRVPSVRVVAPIPGRNTVGVEVPNDKQVMVRLRELIEASGEDAAKKRIPIFLGKDVTGKPLLVDMAKMPHLLIAGRTGTGKSVCLNTLILSILMSRTPDQVKMLMIDPKMVELSPYTRVPHLMHPVITDMKKAEALLSWAVDTMEERYELLARCGVRHLDNYNELSVEQKCKRLQIEVGSEEADAIPDRMPYIVIIADEMADMMMTSGKDVEGHIIRLAQKSRAVGIHLVLATQKPTVDVITGLIKSNLPARISFQVASRMDSRVVLDENGADKLLGNGDMLYLAPGTSKLTRAQGTYVSDDEVNGVIDFYSAYEPQYDPELAQLKAKPSGDAKGEAASTSDLKSRDEMYEQAIEVVVREGRGSVSLLQRCLGIGYGRAARLIDFMAEDGIVGTYNGSQAREVLYTPEQWAEISANRGMEPADAI